VTVSTGVNKAGWRVLLSGLVAVLAFGLGSPADAATKRRDTASEASTVKPVGVKSRSTAARRATARKAPRMRRAAPVVKARPSHGMQAGLHATDDPLDLKSSVALVMDQDTREVLFDKNAAAVLPIASLTKLMTSLVVVDAGLSLDETLTITQDDVDTEKGSGSRLAVGTQLSRGEMLHLALMASENRAAHALGRHYPGGLGAFVAAMNAKAQLIGMADSRFVEPTGLSSRNQSSARDLARLVDAAYEVALIRDLSVSQEHAVAVGPRLLQFRNTNGLVRNPAWEIGLQKTGYIAEAGRCLVMQAHLAGRKLIMVFLDSTGKYSRIGDAERVRRWVESTLVTPGLEARPDGPKLTS
jgi:D-alanyl-D-alanine endopeptidase (penicillin-binding protein 7)